MKDCNKWVGQHTFSNYLHVLLNHQKVPIVLIFILYGLIYIYVLYECIRVNITTRLLLLQESNSI